MERKRYPNVDFHSGIICKARGIPVSMFTVMFAIAYTAGWVAQWMEQCITEHACIGRPHQIDTGAAVREAVPIDRR